MKRTLVNMKMSLRSIKFFLTFNFFIFYFGAFGAVKTTVTDGDWFSPSNWSPIGVPLNEDTVIVNHYICAYGDKVEFYANLLLVNISGSILCDSIFALHGNLILHGTMNINTYVDSDGSATHIYGELSGLHASPANPITINYGVISSDTLFIGDVFHNYGLIDTDVMTVGGPAFTNYSFGSIVVVSSVIFSTDVVNEINASMTLGDLMTEGLITNHGAIACESWSHFDDTANGSGTYCIENCFQNYADIEGTLDICDVSPGTLCDWNFGTIAPTTTSCSVSPCANNLSVEENKAAINIYPNPATSYIMLKNVVKGSQWNIVDSNGKKVVSGMVATDIIQIDISQFSAGVYVLQIQNENDWQVSKFLKN